MSRKWPGAGVAHLPADVEQETLGGNVRRRETARLGLSINDEEVGVLLHVLAARSKQALIAGPVWGEKSASMWTRALRADADAWPLRDRCSMAAPRQ